MPQQGLTAEPAPSLSGPEADHRKAILNQLKDALEARRISSVVVGRHTLVLRSGGCGAPPKSADPQLHIFVAGGIDIVTTDGDVFRFTSGHTHPAADPSGAALGYSEPVIRSA
jgi:hypothetical protein